MICCNDHAYHQGVQDHMPKRKPIAIGIENCRNVFVKIRECFCNTKEGSDFHKFSLSFLEYSIICKSGFF